MLIPDKVVTTCKNTVPTQPTPSPLRFPYMRAPPTDWLTAPERRALDRVFERAGTIARGEDEEVRRDIFRVLVKRLPPTSRRFTDTDANRYLAERDEA